jgi:hypothetical protein
MKSAQVALAELHMANSLASEGKYDEALAKHLWFHAHALQHDQSLGGVRLSFALEQWVALGEQYPKARQSFLAVRDETTLAIEQGQGSFMMFCDVAAMNKYLQEEPKTVALFHAIDQRHPELASQCYAVAEEYLVGSMEYEICSKYMGDPQAKFEAICQQRQLTLEIADENPALGAPEAGLRFYADWAFANRTRHLLEILEGIGRTEDAQRIRQLGHAISEEIAEFGTEDQGP